MIARTNKFILLVLISLQMIFAGCIVLPIPTGEDKILDGMPVTEDQLKFLKVGVTSRDEVISHLGNPSLIWENAKLFVYIKECIIVKTL
jgi:outer membrane protein assembly factor BamE (lipoprotein component of BamABCDE complex)